MTPSIVEGHAKSQAIGPSNPRPLTNGAKAIQSTVNMGGCVGDTENVVFCRHIGSARPRWRCFDGLVDVVQTRRTDEVLPKLAELDRAVASGLFAAGMISYEASPGFDAAFACHSAGSLPLVWF
ncbi:MAG: hypothetical protein LLG00_11015, partial [Planctomycetaceae bacterium]|nr:hypothetical protein [Planctomycetaceae bacterium]